MKGKYINQKSNSNYRKIYDAIWDIDKIEALFKSRQLPTEIRLNKYTLINNVQKFIKSHLEFIRSNNGNITFTPYHDRLMELLTFTQTD